MKQLLLVILACVITTACSKKGNYDMEPQGNTVPIDSSVFITSYMYDTFTVHNDSTNKTYTTNKSISWSWIPDSTSLKNNRSIDVNSSTIKLHLLLHWNNYYGDASSDYIYYNNKKYIINYYDTKVDGKDSILRIDFHFWTYHEDDSGRILSVDSHAGRFVYNLKQHNRK